MTTANFNILSSSSLEGTSVVNTTGEDIGKVEDLMIDVDTGRVVYAVLSFGGFLGMGDKLFAIPLKAFAVDTEKERMILNVPKDKLENAPGFDKDNWPTGPNWDFADSVYRHYDYEPYSETRDAYSPVLS